MWINSILCYDYYYLRESAVFVFLLGERKGELEENVPVNM